MSEIPHGPSGLTIPLALPYNHDPAYPEWLDGHADGVGEVYLPVHGSVAPTARPWMGPRERDAYRAELKRLAVVLSAHGVQPNVVVNLPHWKPGRLSVIDEIGVMRDILGENTAVTIACWDLGRRLRAAFPSIDLCVSTAAQVDSERGARFWREGLGVRSIVVSREVNRMPSVLAAIRSVGVRVKIVLDDACLPGCPALVTHTALMMEPGAFDRETASCFMLDERLARPWLIAQKDVVPAALPRYAGIVDLAKMEGRAQPLETIDRKRSAYLAAESWSHVYGLYREPPEAHDRITTCDRRCEDCGWCPSAFLPADVGEGQHAGGVAPSCG